MKTLLLMLLLTGKAMAATDHIGGAGFDNIQTAGLWFYLGNGRTEIWTPYGNRIIYGQPGSHNNQVPANDNYPRYGDQHGPYL